MEAVKAEFGAVKAELEAVKRRNQELEKKHKEELERTSRHCMKMTTKRRQSRRVPPTKTRP